VGAALSRASAQAVTPGDNSPIQIQADSGIEWQQDAHVYIARRQRRRDPRSRRNPCRYADRPLPRGERRRQHRRQYRDLSGRGGGRVTLKRDAQTVVGDRAVYDVDQAIAVVTGKNLQLTTPSDTVTARDSLDWLRPETGRRCPRQRGSDPQRQNRQGRRVDRLSGQDRAGAGNGRCASRADLGPSRRNLWSRRRVTRRASAAASASESRSAGSMRKAMSSSTTRPIPGAAISASTRPIPASRR